MPGRILVVPMNWATNRFCGLAIDVLGLAQLLDASRLHHGDAVGDGQRLLLVVRDVDGGDLQALLQVADLAAHVDPQPGIEVGQRLVEQQHFRADDQGARNGDALQLAAGELVRPALAVALQPHEGERARDALGDLLGRDLARLEAVGDVAGHGEVGEDGVVLEHHADVAPVRRQRVDALLTDADLAGIELGEAGDHAQQRGLAAAGGTQQGEELAVLDSERDIANGCDRSEGPADAFDRDLAQRLPSPGPETQRVSWMMSLILSSVAARTAVQASSL